MGIVRFSNTKRVNVNGQWFKNLNRACLFFNKNHNNVSSRIRRGWTLEEALDLIDRVNNSRCQGKVYKIINAVNDKIYVGITSRSLETRFTAHKYEARIGSTLKLHLAMREYGLDKFEIHLIKQSSDWRKLQKLEMYYINKFDSISKGYNTSTGGNGSVNRCGTKVEYGGRVYNSITELSRELGMHKDTLAWRINRNLPLKGWVRSKRVTYNGMTFDSVPKLAQHLGLNEQIVRLRLKNNVDLAKPVISNKRKTIVFKGVTYRSLKDLSIKLDVPYTLVQYRYNKNIPFDLPIRRKVGEQNERL